MALAQTTSEEQPAGALDVDGPALGRRGDQRGPHLVVHRRQVEQRGGAVQPGQVVMRLDEVQSGSTLDALRAQRGALLAQMARLSGEMARAQAIPFPPELLNATDARTMEAIAGQRALFQARMSNLARQQMYYGRFATVDEIVADVDRVTPADIQRIANELLQHDRISLTLLGNLGYDPTYGARPLKRVIQRQLVDQLALALLEGRFSDGDTIRVDAREGELVFEKAGSAEPATAAA